MKDKGVGYEQLCRGWRRAGRKTQEMGACLGCPNARTFLKGYNDN